MKVTHKQLIGTGLGLAAGFIIGRNLDVGLRTLKTIDAKVASSLSSLQSLRWVAYSAVSLGAVIGLARSIELETDSTQKTDDKKPDSKKLDDKKPSSNEFRPALRHVKDTDRVPSDAEKKEVREVLEKCGVTVPNDDQNKEFLFWYEFIQWVKAIGDNTPQQVSKEANENPRPRCGYTTRQEQRLQWGDTPLYQVYSVGMHTDNGDWARGRFMIGLMPACDQGWKAGWHSEYKKSNSVLTLGNEVIDIHPDKASLVIKATLKKKWPTYPWNSKGVAAGICPYRDKHSYGLTFFDNEHTRPKDDNNNNN